MKNLENEYKDQISHEKSELWSRIEAGVDAYEASKNSNVQTFTPVTPIQNPDNNISRIRRKKFMDTFPRIAIAAACLVLAVFSFNMVRNIGNKSASPSASPGMNESPSPSPAYESDHSNAADAMYEAETDYSEAAEPEQNKAAESDRGKNYEAAAEFSEDASPAFEPAVEDMLYDRLYELGFTDITGLKPEDNYQHEQSLNINKEEEMLKTASFTDTQTNDRCLLFYTVTDGEVEILAVTKDGDDEEFLYEKP